jgi:hypothetical protein
MTENASQAALKAISKMHEEEFAEMQTIATQFMWCSFYFYGTSYEPQSTDRFKYNDFRTDIEYQKFAAKYNAAYRYIFINTAGYVNGSDFENCCRRLVASVDSMTTLLPLDENGLKGVIRELAAIDYFGKTSAFQAYFNEVHSGKKSIINTLKQNYNNEYIQGLKDIQSFTMIPASEFSEYEGNFISSECSWAPQSIKKRYLEIKTTYEQHLQQLFNILLDSPDLTICYNNASVGNVNANNNKGDICQYVDINQVLACCGELLMNKAEEKDDEELLKKIYKEVPELVEQRMTELGYTKLKLIIIFALLIVLFIITCYNFVLSIKNYKSMKKLIV